VKFDFGNAIMKHAFPYYVLVTNFCALIIIYS